MIKIDFELASRLPKSKQKRRQCFPVIANIVCCSYLTRKEGLIALDNFVPDLPSSVGAPDLDKFLKIGVQWAAKGISEENISRFINAILSSKDRKGTELLSYMIAAEGILSIRRREHPKLMLDHIHCMIGLDLKDELDEAKDNASDLLKKQKRIKDKDVIERYFSNQDKDFKPDIFDKLLRKLDESTFHDLLYYTCYNEKFGHALLSCHKETVAFVLEQFNPYASDIRDALLEAHATTSKDLQKEAVAHIIFTITSKKTGDS